MPAGKSDTFIVARTDSIGDVVLTLPMCGLLKRHFPDARILFIGRKYTRAVVECCTHVDRFYDWDEVENLPVADQAKWMQQLSADTIIHAFPNPEIVRAAKRAAIPRRIATAGRWFTFAQCNYPVFFSRKNSELHEAQLNMKLLRPLGMKQIPGRDEIPSLYGFIPRGTVPGELEKLIHPGKFNVILHPMSRGSAVEWGMDNFGQLIAILPPSRFNVFITGTESEGKHIRKSLEMHHATDLSGQLSLDQLITFISACDGLVAASTGPLHISSACGRVAIGLYSPKRPIHPGRWEPLGHKAISLVASVHPASGFLDISPEEVANRLLKCAAEKEEMS